MTKRKAEAIERMIMKELCRESLTDLLDYWEVSLSELEQFMEQAKADLSENQKNDNKQRTKK